MLILWFFNHITYTFVLKWMLLYIGTHHTVFGVTETPGNCALLEQPCRLISNNFDKTDGNPKFEWHFHLEFPFSLHHIMCELVFMKLIWRYNILKTWGGCAFSSKLSLWIAWHHLLRRLSRFLLIKFHWKQKIENLCRLLSCRFKIAVFDLKFEKISHFIYLSVFSKKKLVEIYVECFWFMPNFGQCSKWVFAKRKIEEKIDEKIETYREFSKLVPDQRQWHTNSN